MVDWEINPEDSKLYKEFTITLRKILKYVALDFNKNYIMFKNKRKNTQKLINVKSTLINIDFFCECFLLMLEVLINLIKSLAVIPTKQKLKEIVIDWNINIGSYRKLFVKGLDRLKMAKEKSDSKEMTENFNKLSEQSDRILTHFQNNLGSKVAVKLKKKIKRLNVIRTNLS